MAHTRARTHTEEVMFNLRGEAELCGGGVMPTGENIVGQGRREGSILRSEELIVTKDGVSGSQRTDGPCSVMFACL